MKLDVKGEMRFWGEKQQRQQKEIPEKRSGESKERVMFALFSALPPFCVIIGVWEWVCNKPAQTTRRE